MFVNREQQRISNAEACWRSLAGYLPQSPVHSGKHRRSCSGKTKEQHPNAGAQEKLASHGAPIITSPLQNELTFR